MRVRTRARRRTVLTADIFGTPPAPALPAAACHLADLPHPVPDLARFLQLLLARQVRRGFRAPEDLLPRVAPSGRGRCALERETHVLSRRGD